MNTFVLALLATVVAPEASYEIVCEDVVAPFQEKDRTRIQNVRRRLRSRFGDYRRSYIRGHKHAGIDLRGRYSEAVYAICDGEVVDIFGGFPHQTVVIRHVRHGGQLFYSSYKHINGRRVHLGQIVTSKTKIGRLFTRWEHRLARFGGAPVHLHFEIRKSIEDDGAASWSSMTMTQLRQHCLDPLLFLTQSMRPAARDPS